MGEPRHLEVAAKGAVLWGLDYISSRADRELSKDLLIALRDAITSRRQNSEAEKKTHNFYSGLEKDFTNYIFKPIAKIKSENQNEQDLDGSTIQETEDYLKRFWFDMNSKDAYFPEHQPIADIYAEGLLETLRLSLGPENDLHDEPFSIDSWWMHDPRYSDFKLLNFRSAAQVTLIIATPRPLGRLGGGTWGANAVARVTGRTALETSSIAEIGEGKEVR